ncbi:MAG: extracellular solute-binding protein [Chloroflexi bacterium]|nr:extracellular solute-binding protein [Chloroflexota bacterium]
MPRIFHRLFPIFVVMSLALAACSGGEIGATDEPDESSAPPAASGDASVAPSEAAFPEGDVAIELWTKEGDPQIAYVESLAEAYGAEHPNVTIEVVNKDVELLREDLVNTALSPEAAPELVWTVADHVGPFTSAGVIQEITGVDASVYEEGALSAVQVDGTTWGIPISNGNQLMLYFNKSLAGEDAPADTDELIATATENTSGDTFGLVFNETESFWLTPWLAGFDASVFAEDGTTPTLDTPEMQAALEFLYNLKYTDEVMPAECDYTCASDLFTSGSAAYIVNGDWELGNYADQLGDDLGVAPLPTVTETGSDPAPYTAGAFYMVPAAVEGDELTVVLDFISWSTNTENQIAMVEELRRLPANAEALGDAVVTDDPLLAGASEALLKGVPQPTNVEMRCVFDAMNTGIRDVLGAGNSDFAAVTVAMQEAADNCVATL